MEHVLGISPNGTVRQLDCWLDDEGRIALWLHSPESENNGWQIHVPAEDLSAALTRLGVHALPHGAPVNG